MNRLNFRFRKNSSNQLMMMWFRKDLRRLAHYEVAIDVGCGRFVNRHLFHNKTYIGIDIKR